AAAVAHALRDRAQLVVVGERTRYRRSVEAGVPERARGREAERAGLHRLRREPLHLHHVFGGRGFVLGAALPHDVAAARAVPKQPVASIASAAAASIDGAMVTMRPSRTATSARTTGPPVLSTTSPPRLTRSYIAYPLLVASSWRRVTSR